MSLVWHEVCAIDSFLLDVSVVFECHKFTLSEVFPRENVLNLVICSILANGH